MTLEPICANCKNWENWDYCGGARDCKVTENAKTLRDMSCPRFESIEPALVEKLNKWKPFWFITKENQFPQEHTLVLMMYSGQPKTKVGYYEDGVWYKSAGSHTVEPDFWTKLP
jgi:hypothetical protein